MANKQIFQYTDKPIPELTDQFVLQEAGGTYRKTTLDKMHQQKHGFYNYDDNQGAQLVPGTGVWTKLSNDTLGPLNMSTYKPSSMDAAGIWDPATDQFDFSQLSLGDEIQMRLDMDITPGANNQDIDVRILFDIGGVNFSLMIDHIIPKTQDPILNHISYVRMFMGSAGVLANPGELQMRADSTNNVSVNIHGWYVSIIRR